MNDEIWRDIEGYDGKYQVSNLGRVRSYKSGEWKLLKLKTYSNGYLRVDLCDNGKIKYCQVHRLVANAFVENPENNPHINHIDGNKQNNRAENLQYFSKSEVLRGVAKRRRINSGILHHNAKLKIAQVKYIREHYTPRDSEFGCVALAKKFGVTPTIISNVVNNKLYREVI